MEQKVSSLVITVDLCCCRSLTKIRKTLCKLQESEDIRAIMYDDKAGTVTISGGFDPLVLPCKLRRKAGSVIKDIHLNKERKKNRVPPPPPQPAPAARAAFCTICGAGVAPGRVCVCHGHYRCHCGGGYGAAPPCYGVPIGGGCSVIQFTYDEPSPACTIM
uniref:HMA domain-containing protein n=1 Tax=Oryza punctata TaxID=4537 RepID=A0A0E0M6F1_ORYPU